MLRSFLFAFLLSLFAMPAMAQQTTPPAAPSAAISLPVADAQSMPATTDLKNLPPMDAKALDDGAPIRLSPDGPAVIQLDRDAATVIIGNPNYASAVMENPRMIMLMPGQPGATKIIALDREGKSILNRHVLVGSNKSDFMRINRVCALGTETCMAQSVYYCPDGDKCYEAAPSQSGGNVSLGGAPSAGPAPVADTGSTTPTEVPTETYQETVE
ncbi:MAG TPA: pilus assembly protein N-terminal domain-containing protein [Alphaproteobacteria bacterium]